MKITCPACNASYRLPDERIQGKNRIFKINCKRCGAEIRVRGVETQDEVGRTTLPFALELPAEKPVVAAPIQVWFAGIEGKQVGPLSESEVAEHIQHGRLAPQDLVWRKGFAAWLPACEVPPFDEMLAETTPGAPAVRTDKKPRRAQTLELSAAMIELLVKLDGQSEQAGDGEPPPIAAEPPQLPPLDEPASRSSAAGSFTGAGIREGNSASSPAASALSRASAIAGKEDDADAMEVGDTQVAPVPPPEDIAPAPPPRQPAKVAKPAGSISPKAAAVAAAAEATHVEMSIVTDDVIAEKSGAVAGPSIKIRLPDEPTSKDKARGRRDEVVPIKVALPGQAEASGSSSKASSVAIKAAGSGAGAAGRAPAASPAPPVARATGARPEAAAPAAGAPRADVTTARSAAGAGRPAATRPGEKKSGGMFALAGGAVVFVSAVVAGIVVMGKTEPAAPAASAQASAAGAVAAAPPAEAAPVVAVVPPLAEANAAVAPAAVDPAAADAAVAAPADDVLAIAAEPDVPAPIVPVVAPAEAARLDAALAKVKADAEKAAADKVVADKTAADKLVVARIAADKAAVDKSAAGEKAAQSEADRKAKVEADRKAKAESANADKQAKAEEAARKKAEADVARKATAENAGTDKRAKAEEAARLKAERDAAAKAAKADALQAKADKDAAAKAAKDEAARKKAEEAATKTKPVGDEDEIEAILSKQRAKAAGKGAAKAEGEGDGDGDAGGGLNQTQVNAVAGKASTKVTRCYLLHADVEGGEEAIKVTLHVNADGSVNIAKVIGKYANHAVGKCVVEAVKTLTFPQSSGTSKKYTVRYTVGG